MTPEEKRAAVEDYLSEESPEAILFDGLDDALIGVASQWGQPTLVVYSYDKLVATVKYQGPMSYEEAVEYVDFNVVGLWAGPGTPLILQTVEDIAT